MTDEQLQKWLSLLPPDPAPVPESSSLLGRGGKSIANLPSNIAQGFSNSLITLGQLGHPGHTDQVDVPNFFDIPEAQTTPETILDMVLGESGLVDVVGQSLIPAGLIGRAGKAAGILAGPKLEAAKWAGGFLFPELNREGAEAPDYAVATGLGAVMGATNYMPRKARLLPTLATALAHGGYETARHDLNTGLIAFGADLVGGMLPGKMDIPEGPLRPPRIRPEPTSGELQGPLLGSLDDAGDAGQHQLYKLELARLQNEQLAAATEQAAYQQGARGSLKEGVRISNPEALPEHVPFADLLASFEGTLPPRTTAAGVAQRRAIFDPDSIGSRGIATLQNEGELLNAPSILSGLDPISPHPNPGIIFPAEQVAGGVRSAEQIAAMQKSQKVRKPRAKKEKPVVQPVEPVPEVAPPVVPDTATTPVNLEPSSEAIAAHAQRLSAQARRPSEVELRSMLSDLDNDIANTLDPEAVTDFKAMRSAVEQLLAIKKPTAPTQAAAVEVPTPVATAAKPAPFQVQERVMTRTKKGVENHGTFEGFTESGQAKVRFDGDAEAVTLNTSKLLKSSKAAPDARVPQIATLQKVKKPLLDDEEANFVAKWLEGQKLTSIGDDIPDDIAGQDFTFDLGPRTKVSSSPTLKGQLPDPAHKAVTKIAQAITSQVNKNLKIQLKEGRFFSGPENVGRSTDKGVIQINLESITNKFKNWDSMTPKDKAVALADVSRWIGHEAGHTILNLMSAKNPRVLSKLIVEFEALGDTGRRALVKDFHDMIGHNDHMSVMYSSGNPESMAAQYGWHSKNTQALNYSGVHEFFAEMSAAHIFGKLKVDMLPPEMKNLWVRFKELIKGVVDRMFRSTDQEFDSIDEELAYRNFQKILKNLHERFSLVDEIEMRQLGKESHGAVKSKIETFVKQEEKVKRRVAYEDYEARVQQMAEEERLAAEAIHSKSKYQEGPPETAYGYYNDEGEFVFATLQSSVNRPAGQMNRPIVGNRGFIEAQMAQHLGAGIAGMIAGGVGGPQLTNGQITVAEGIFMGGVLGFAGPIAFRRLLMTRPQADGHTFQHLNAKEGLKMLFTGKGRHLLGGDAATGQGAAPAKFIRFLERNLNLHLPPQIFNAVVQSEGPASLAVQIASDAFAKARTYQTTTVINNAVEDYLRGRSSATQLRQLLGGDPEAQQFANFIVTGRESIGLLQEMVVSGLKEGAFKNKIIASLQKGDYLTRQFRMFHDPDYKPKQNQIEALAMELAHAHPEYDLSTARLQVEDYLHQIEIERGMFQGGKNSVGQKLDAALFQKKNDKLSAAFRDALGEYKDPKEQIMGTIRHLYTNAVSSKFYDHVANMTDLAGLKMSYSFEEHGAALQAIDAKLRHPRAGTTPEQIATLQKQRRELEFYVPLDRNLRYGKLGGKLVNRFVRDQLASFDSPWGLMDGSIMRSLSSFHNWIKVGRTALNPITVVRNMISAPVLMGLARANPFHAPEAMKAIRDMSQGLGREMLEQGIYGVDQVRGEFFRSAEQILMGDYDHRGLEGIFKTGMNKVLEFYRLPDMLARGTTYISAKKRFAGEFNLPETDRRVIDAARDWTNRYTVNYANVAPLVKTLRQIPFTNLFISYTAEITRITKNLIEDIFTHPSTAQRLHATGAVGALVSLPFLIEKGSQQNLSPKDREEWQKSQAQMPDYSRSRFRMVLGKENGRYRYMDITPLLQIDPLLQMMRNGANGDWKAFLATNPVLGWENTPILNIAAEQIAGKDLRTGRPLNTPVKRVQEAVKEIVPPLAPGGYEFQRATEAFSTTDTGERGITNLRTGRRTTPGELVTSYLTGMRLGSLDTNFLHRNVVSEAKRRIANEASYFRDIAQTNLPASTKQKAQERYKRAVEGILSDMRQRLEGEVP